MSSMRPIIGLDIVRVGAALMVALHHFYFWTWDAAHSATQRIGEGAQALSTFGQSMGVGWVGVQIFFVLSGFIVFHTSHETTPLSFLKRRIIRLLPAALVCASVTGLVLSVVGEVGAGELIWRWGKSVVFYPFEPWIDMVYWTLPIEAVFYGLFCLLLWCGCVRHLDKVLLLVASVYPLILLAVDSGFLAAEAVTVTTMRVAELALIRNGGEFALGILLWKMICDRVTVRRCLGVALCLGFAFLDLATNVEGMRQTTLMEWSFAPPIGIWLFALCLIVIAVKTNDIVTRPLSVRSLTLLRRVGEMTYPFYLLHQTIGVYLIATSERAGLLPVAARSLSLVLITGLAFGVGRFAEPCLRSWLCARLSLRN